MTTSFSFQGIFRPRSRWIHFSLPLPVITITSPSWARPMAFLMASFLSTTFRIFDLVFRICEQPEKFSSIILNGSNNKQITEHLVHSSQIVCNSPLGSDPVIHNPKHKLTHIWKERSQWLRTMKRKSTTETNTNKNRV